MVCTSSFSEIISLYTELTLLYNELTSLFIELISLLSEPILPIVELMFRTALPREPYSSCNEVNLRTSLFNEPI